MTIRNRVELHLCFILFMSGLTTDEVAKKMRVYRKGRECRK